LFDGLSRVRAAKVCTALPATSLRVCLDTRRHSSAGDDSLIICTGGVSQQKGGENLEWRGKD